MNFKVNFLTFANDFIYTMTITIYYGGINKLQRRVVYSDFHSLSPSGNSSRAAILALSPLYVLLFTPLSISTYLFDQLKIQWN